MNISAGFIHRPIGTTLLAVALILIGAALWPQLPVAPLPQVDFPTIQVSASLPGASSEIMASNVAQPLERQFSQIAGLSQMTSQSALGTTQITVQFDLNRNIDGAALDIQAAINAASGQLPTNLPSPPTFRKINPADSPILVMSVQSDTLPLTQVNDYADNILAQQISQISGVGLVNIGGAQKPAIRIQVDPTKLAALGIALEDLRGVIATTTVNQPAGNIDGKHQSFTVYTNDQVLGAAPWNDIVLAYRHGAPVRVRDVGIAIDGPENAKVAAWAYRGAGAPADSELRDDRTIILAITKQPGANVLDTVDRIEAALPRLRAAIPPTVTVAPISDRSQNIRASVKDVEFTLVLTILAVVLVIFVFLREVAATIIPGITVPLAILGTAAVMYIVGYSLDNLSLMALTIAVGFVVDDAIVMLENIYRHVEDGMSPMEAALKGAGEIGFTIISISVSLVAVFIPLLLMGGIVGRLFREFSVTVTLTIVVSVLVSLTLTPMLCSRFLRSQHERRHGRLYQLCERGFDGMLAGYKRGLDIVLRHSFITLCGFIATVVLTVLMFIWIPKGFFPQQDTGFVFGFVESSQDSSFQAMIPRMLKIADVIRQDPDVAGFAMPLGQTTTNSGNLYIGLKPKDEGRTASADEIIGRLRPKLAQVEGVTAYLQAGQDINVGGRLSRTQYQYTLTDANLDELNTWAPKTLDRFKQLKELTDVASDQQNNAAAATLTIDRARASSFGITPSMIDSTLYDAIGQRQVAQYFTQLNSYHVVLEVTPAMQEDPALFDKLYITSPITQQQVPLSAFVKVDTTKTAYLSIGHQGQFPAVTISFNLAPGYALGDATKAIDAAQHEMNTPQALIGSFQGTAKAFGDSLSSQPLLIAAALVAVYIVLGLLYESYIHPLTILSTLPSAGLGALLILRAGGYDLSVIALIGIILLIGIVKKNGIMMVDFALSAERERHLSSRDAIYEACLLRFRPIMMTTMCALISGLPLMLGHGAGSELRRPLGYAMVGGLLLSQALTLFTTPVIYLYLDGAHLWYEKRKEAKKNRKHHRRAALCVRRPSRRRIDLLIDVRIDLLRIDVQRAAMKILVVEDELKMADYLGRGLIEQGYIVDQAHDGIDGQHLALQCDYDVIVLDVMLPGLDGFSLLRSLRAVKDTPVIMLTARDRIEDRVRGLREGADDYLVKPFSFLELVARLQALARRGRSQERLYESSQLRIGDLHIDLLSRKVVRDGLRLDLTAKEFALLSVLARRSGEVLSKTVIAELVWDMNFDSNTNVVEVAIKRLRAKIDGPYANNLLHTVRGMGYVLEERHEHAATVTTAVERAL